MRGIDRRRLRWAALAAPLLALTACQSTEPGSGPLTMTARQAALPTMENIMLAASRCWFDADPAFAPYAMAPELDSMSGRPRILIVPREAPQSRPLAVVQASGEPATIEVFGPLMGGPLGARIAADVGRWNSGSEACGAAA